MKNLKYLAAYILPTLAFIGLWMGEEMTFLTPIVAFGLIPLVEYILPQKTENLADEQRSSLLEDRLFDYLLYLNVPLVYGLVGLFIYQLNTAFWTTSELVGATFSVSIVIGTCAINVGHELGHRNNAFDQFLSKTLYLPALYQHFFIEHNRGHHKNVATPLDPASARRDEILYTFWFRSLWGSYKSAWQLEQQKLAREGHAFWSIHNEMIRFTVIQAIYLAIVFVLTNSLTSLLLVVLAALVGVLFLETINYVEHYGLRRKKLANGRYERVQPHHSWNADYQLGRIMLYELTRHSDHHYISDKKYQILDHHIAAPQLPVGYPGAMLLSLIPPLWFRVMNKQLDELTL